MEGLQKRVATLKDDHSSDALEGYLKRLFLRFRILHVLHTTMPATHHDIYIRTRIYIYCVKDFCGVYRLVGSCLVVYCALVFLMIYIYITVVMCHLWLYL
jgi:hypothetical protein